MFGIFKPKQNSPDKKEGDKSEEVDLGRRNILKAGAAVGLTTVAGGMWESIISDPEFKDKVYSGMAEYFNEKALEAKLEKEIAEFEAKYGIKLKLRSLDQVYNDFKEVNDTEIERLKIVQAIANSVYEREINKSLTGYSPTSDDMYVISGEHERMVKQITEEYIKDNPIGFANPNFTSKTLSTLDKLNLITHMRFILSTFPTKYIKSLGIDYIDAGSETSEKVTVSLYDPVSDSEKDKKQISVTGPTGLATAGYKHPIHGSKGRNIYLDYKSLGNDSGAKNQELQGIATVLTHELSHAKDNKNSDDYQAPLLATWKEKVLTLGSQDYISDYWIQAESLSSGIPPIGFARHYGMHSPQEDRATIAEKLFSSTFEISERCKFDTVLAAKVALMKEEFKKEHPAFDDTYWNLMVAGDLQKVIRYVELSEKFGKPEKPKEN